MIDYDSETMMKYVNKYYVWHRSMMMVFLYPIIIVTTMMSLLLLLFYDKKEFRIGRREKRSSKNYGDARTLHKGERSSKIFNVNARTTLLSKLAPGFMSPFL